MTYRSLTTGRLLAAAVVALALTLGPLGAANAADLTRAAVKKIAVKVVKKQAKTLTVAHARTAGTATSATKVGGFTGAQLRTTGFRYALPTQTAAASRTYHFPGLPPGAYLVSYNYGATVSNNGTQIGCSLVTEAGTSAVSYSADAALTVRATATDSVIVGSDPTLDCSGSGGTYSISTGMVTFIPIDTVVTGTTVGNTV